jgi:hypothetical protein
MKKIVCENGKKNHITVRGERAALPTIRARGPIKFFAVYKRRKTGTSPGRCSRLRAGRSAFRLYACLKQL